MNNAESTNTTDHKDREVIKRIERLLVVDDVYKGIEVRFRALEGAFRLNDALLKNGSNETLEPLDVVGDDQYSTYPIQFSRRGTIVSHDVKKHPHLVRKELPGAVQFTQGDLMAAGEWGMLPEVESNSVKPHQIEAARQVQEAEYLVKSMRLFELAKARIVQFIKAENKVRSKGMSASMEEIVAGLGDLTGKIIKDHDGAAGTILERVAYSMLCRLGSKAHDRFRAERTPPLDDILEHTDIVLFFPDAHGDVRFSYGLDITTHDDSRKLWDKEIKISGYGSDRKLTSHKSSLSGMRDHQVADGYAGVSRLPTDISKSSVYRLWQENRGDTTLTPEYFLSPDQRTRLAHALLHNVVDGESNKIFMPDDSDVHIRTLAQKTYGAFTPRFG